MMRASQPLQRLAGVRAVVQRGICLNHVSLSAAPQVVLAPKFARCMSSDSANPPIDAKLPAAASSNTSYSFLATVRQVLDAGKAARNEKAEKNTAETGAKALNTVTLKRLWEFAKPEIVPLSVSVATLAVTTGISLVFPAAIGQILDVALKPDALLSPASISLGLLGLFIVQSGMIALRSGLLTIAGERIAASMRKDLFTAVLSQDIAWFDKQRTGDILNRLSSDTVVIQKALTSNIANGLRSAAMVAGGTGMLFYLSPSLALLSLSLIPPVAIAGMHYGRYLQGQQRAVQAALGRTTELGEEMLAAVRTVRQFAREPREAARFAARVDESYLQAKQIGVVAAYFDGFVHMAANASLIAVLWYGGHQVWSGGMSAGDLTAFLMYSLYTGFNVSSLSTVYTELKRAAGAAMRVVEITDRLPAMPLSSDPTLWQAATAATDSHGMLRRGPSPIVKAAAAAVDPACSRTLPTVQGALRFEGVRFAYPTRTDVPILTDFSLEAPAGKMIALVGASGSGKSTVGSLLTRLYDVDAGKVTLDGHDIRQLDPMWLRRQIGVVSQEPTLFATTILENIRYGCPQATQEEVEEAARLASVHDTIMKFPDNYSTVVGERGIQLSGGQRQRVAIARALITRPPVLLMDEATSALDSDSEAAIMQALDNVSKGRTVVTIAHRLSTMKHADLIAVISNGRITETGTFSELMSNPQSAFRILIEKQVVGTKISAD